MIYRITFLRNKEQHTMEWVVPTGWSHEAISHALEQQYPSAEVLNLEPTEVLA